MRKRSRCVFPLAFILAGTLSVAAPSTSQTLSPTVASIQAGEVSSTGVILQARLTTGRRLANGDLPGSTGMARFSIAASERFADGRTTAWVEALPANDYIIKQVVDGLRPDTRYYYRLEYGADRDRTRESEVGTFRTLAGPDGRGEIRLAVGSCMHYSRHYFGPDRTDPLRPDSLAVGTFGFATFDVIRETEPDYYIGVGDNVYYDHPIPGEAPATTLDAMRVHWHRQYAVPTLVALLRTTPAYWLKDDHDFRYNDADTTRPDLGPSVEAGIHAFREQVPLVDPSDPNARTYRTHRFNRHLQIWMIEVATFAVRTT